MSDYAEIKADKEIIEQEEGKQMSTPDIRDIVRESLKLGGWDGLYNPECCACLVDDLMPCGEPSLECSAGYRQDGCQEWCGEGCDFHIVSTRPRKDPTDGE